MCFGLSEENEVQQLNCSPYQIVEEETKEEELEENKRSLAPGYSILMMKMMRRNMRPEGGRLRNQEGTEKTEA